MINGRSDISIFDIDDTLVITKSRIRVRDSKTGKCLSLTPAQFNKFEREPHHEMDFSDFRDLEILKAGRLVEKVFRVFRRVINSNKPVGIITAREDVDLIQDFLDHHGIHIERDLIFAVNDPKCNLQGTIAEKKQQAFEQLIDRGFRTFTFYDDDIKNIRLAMHLAEQHDGVKIIPKHIDGSWRSNKRKKRSKNRSLQSNRS